MSSEMFRYMSKYLGVAEEEEEEEKEEESEQG